MFKNIVNIPANKSNSSIPEGVALFYSTNFVTFLTLDQFELCLLNLLFIFIYKILSILENELCLWRSFFLIFIIAANPYSLTGRNMD